MGGSIDDGGEETSTVSVYQYAPSRPAEVAFTLSVVEGEASPTTLTLDDGHPSRLLVGKSPACDLRASTADVSRRHAAFELVGNRLCVTDLKSTNGTFVNGICVGEAYLAGGEVVRMGSLGLRVDTGPMTTPIALPQSTSFGRMVGWSREMRRLYLLCERLAITNVPVIIEGETGTGKELLAEALHEQGPRASAPFVVFDCTAIPANLVEAELFGHERGAFTGAVTRRKGLLEQAHGGTLLIDEIGDLDLALQPKLLRAIERKAIRRIGGDSWTQVDVRLLAATRRDLDAEVQAGRFRDDLFHRLAVARIELPPLRQRHGDIGLLARHFAVSLGAQPSSMKQDLLSRWEAYAWPGNVRELHNAVARQLALGDLNGEERRFSSDQPTAERALGDVDGGDPFARVLSQRLPFSEARQRILTEFERCYIERVLAEHAGNVARAAAASGIGRRYFNMVRSRVG